MTADCYYLLRANIKVSKFMSLLVMDSMAELCFVRPSDVAQAPWRASPSAAGLDDF